jgi:hypothetical protein
MAERQTLRGDGLREDLVEAGLEERCATFKEQGEPDAINIIDGDLRT